MDNNNNNNNNNNNDKKKKQRQQEDEKTKARNRKDSSSASKPGAVSVSGSEASRLDQRITDKRSKTNGAASLERMEQDIQAKQQARRGGVERAQQQPGAVSVTNPREQLQTFESDMAAKHRAVNNSKPGAMSVTGPAQLQSLEQDVAAKHRAAAGGGSSSTSKPGATAVRPGQAELQGLEASVAAKNRTATTTTSTAGMTTNNNNYSQNTTANAVSPQAQLQSLEDRLHAKVRGEPKPPPPLSAAVGLQALDDAVAAKNCGNRKLPPPVDPNNNYAFNDAAEMKIRENAKPPPPSSAKMDSKLPAAVVTTTPDNDAAAVVVGHDDYVDNDKKGLVGNGSAHRSLKGAATDTPHLGDNNNDLEYGVYETDGNNEGLAVAIAIDEEEEENVFIPAAVEYDPDAKPPIYQNRRFRLYSIVAGLILVVIAVTAGVGISLAQNNNNDEQSKAQYRQSLGIEEKVQALVGADKLEDSTSPYNQALRWMTVGDPMELFPEDPGFLQRYMMAYFYFATSEQRPWAFCGAPEEDDNENDDYDSSCLAFDYPSPLVDLDDKQLPLPGSVRWVSDKHECEWFGVECDAFQQVVGLSLGGVEMTGVFPEGIVHLPFLQNLVAFRGELRGNFPQEVTLLRHLRRLEIDMNSLTGPLPSEMEWSYPNLYLFSVGNNRISGSMKPLVPALEEVRMLRLGANLFDGSIPSDIDQMQSLSEVSLQRNLLTGSIPTQIGNMPRLFSLNLFDNDINGTLPTEIGQLSALGILEAQNNPRLSGEIIPEIYLPTMNRIGLFNCNFTGTISERISDMTNLFFFAVQNNHLHGKLPTGFSDLTLLGSFSVQGNDITGEVPEELCKLREDSVLGEIGADCLAPEGSGDAEVSCSTDCCTLCCNPSGDCELSNLD